MDDGYIKLHRTIRKNFLWQDKPFTKGQAWIDLLMDARFDDGGYFKRGIWIPLTRGQVGRSELTLASNWGWSRGKVRRFLETLKTEQMVTLKQDNKTTVVSICNYEIYQGKESSSGTPNSTADGTPNEHQTNTKRYTKNKEKKEKKEDNTCTRFEIFWKEYPKKKSKGQAEKAFNKIKMDDILFSKIIAAIRVQKKSIDWIKEKGQYIPYPSSWLNARGWEDEDIPIYHPDKSPTLTAIPGAIRV